MRSSSLLVRYVYFVSIGTFLQIFGPSAAYSSNTNVFLSQNSLIGAGLSASGMRVTTFKRGSDFILGTNSSATLAVSVHDLDCTESSPRPIIRLVAYNRAQSKIVAPLVEFTEVHRVLVGVSKIILQAHGTGLSGVEGADLDALITLTHVPCTSSNSTIAPQSVLIQPLGTIKPTGTPAFQAPLTADDGALLFITDDPNKPVLQVDVAGIPTEPSPTCNIDLSATTVAFGNVVVGTNSVQSFIIRNNGSLPCTINSITRNGSSAFAVGGPGWPFAVQAGSAVTIPVTFTPTNGADSAVLRITSTDPIAPQQYVTVTGTGTATTPCNINASPLLLPFGSVEIGTNKTLSVTLTNSGGTDCTVDLLTMVTLSSNFSVSAPAIPFSIAPGTSEVLTVTYTPIDTTGATGTLEIDNDDADNRLILVSMTATGINATCRLAVDQTSLDFGAVVIGGTRELSVGITNVSLISCTINSTLFTGSGQFSSTSTSSISILPGDSTNIVFVYTPTNNAAVTGSCQLQVGSPSQTDFSIALKGRGVAVSSNCTFVISRSDIDFGDVAVGTTDVQKFQISNTSLSNCVIQSLTLTGSSDFTVVAPALPITLPGTNTVEIGVRYLPGTAGQDVGQLEVITDDFVNPIVDIPLMGNGVKCILQVSTNAVDFGAVLVGGTAGQTVFVTNTNTVNCTITSISKSGSGDFILDPVVPTGQFILRPFETVEIPVQYLPSNQGSDTGSVSINGNQVGTPTIIALTGLGLRQNLGVTPATLSFGGIQLRTTNSLSLTINNTGNTNGTVEAIEAIGSSRYRVTNPSPPFTVPPGQPLTITVEYLPVNIQTIIIQGGAVKSSGNPTIVTP